MYYTFQIFRSLLVMDCELILALWILVMGYLNHATLGFHFFIFFYFFVFFLYPILATICTFTLLFVLLIVGLLVLTNQTNNKKINKKNRIHWTKWGSYISNTLGYFWQFCSLGVVKKKQIHIICFPIFFLF